MVGTAQYQCPNLPYPNGGVPSRALKSIGEGSHKLYGPAADAYLQMKQAALRDGVKVDVTDSYRTLASQIQCRANKGSLCAKPGTSKHGCGLAIDVRTQEARSWVQANGARFGWVWPLWARGKAAGGSKDEPWHFEYQIEGTADPSGVTGFGTNQTTGAWQPSNPLIPDSLETLGHFASILSDPAIWVRVGWVGGGGVAVLIGLYLIGKEFGLPSVTDAAKVAAKAGALAA